MRRLLPPLALATVTVGVVIACLSRGILSAPPPWPHPEADTFSIGTDDGLSLTLSADGQVVGLAMDGEPLPLTPGPALWVRDVSHAGEVSEPNLLANPGFEEGEAHWRSGGQSGITVTITDSVSRSGDWSLQMRGYQTDTLGYALMVADAITVTPGQRYRLSGYFLSGRGYVQTPDGTPPRRQDEIWRGISRPNGLYLHWLDGEGSQLGDLTLVAPLHWEAYTWRKICGEVRAPPDAAQLELIIGGLLQGQSLWVDDLSIVASPEGEQPITGVVTQQGERLVQTATVTAGLTLTATYTGAADRIEVHLELQDTAGVDRALEVILALPVDADGWRWWDDVRHSRPIITGIAVADPPPEYPLPSSLSWTYEHVVSGVWDGWLPISLYPYALIEDGDHGLALAVSLDSPRLVKLAYDQEKGRYEARGYLGISPLAVKLDGQADLSLELYRVDPTWGFRTAIERFAVRHPSWFESSRLAQGYVGYERGHYGSEIGARQVLTDDLKGIFTAEYIVADAPLKDGSAITEPLPTYSDTIGLVEALESSSKVSEQARGKAITRSVAYDPNGDWQIKHVGEYPWAPGVWEVCWATSTDPDITDGWGPLLWDWVVNPVISATEAIGAVLDGVMMDNFMSAPGVDTRPEHLALTDTSLAYHVATYRPGVHNAANMHEFFIWLRERMDARGRDDMAITVNFWGVGTPNGLARHIDAFGGEGKSKTGASTNWNPRILDYRRAIAYHRPQTWANGDPDLTLGDVREFVNLALFYGILPVRKDEATGWEEGADQLITDTRQVLLQFRPAEWEPVTHAWSDNSAVWVERFGTAQDRDEDLFFTVHNTLVETASFTLTVDADALGLLTPQAMEVTELTSGEAMPFEVEGGLVLIRGDIGSLDTLVFRLAAYRFYLPFICAG
ncbi:MAG: hypothetical protein DRI80_00850 [Chloroflexota bacterium]|nr:MAG: hypothetical protein DRI80_00850 [Chloroflexota bacterium]